MMFYALASNSEYIKKHVNLFVALAPAVLIHNAKLANLLNFFAKIEAIIYVKLSEIGVHELFGKAWEQQFEKIKNKIPLFNNLRNFENLSNDLYDDKDKSQVFEGHFPHGTSVRTFSHFS